MIGKKKYDKEVEATEEEVVVVAAPPVVVAPAMAFKKYKVTKGAKILWAGCITTIPLGAEIDESGYGGASGIAKLIEAGIELALIS